MKEEKIEVRAYIYRGMNENFKKIAKQNGKTRTQLFNEILIGFLKDMVVS